MFIKVKLFIHILLKGNMLGRLRHIIVDVENGYFTINKQFVDHFFMFIIKRQRAFSGLHINQNFKVQFPNGTAALEIVWQFLKRLNTELPCNPTILFLDTHPREMKMYVHIKTCIQTFCSTIIHNSPMVEITQMFIT